MRQRDRDIRCSLLDDTEQPVSDRGHRSNIPAQLTLPNLNHCGGQRQGKRPFSSQRRKVLNIVQRGPATEEWVGHRGNPHSRRLLGGSAFKSPNPRKLPHPFGRRPEDQLRLRKFYCHTADPERTHVGSLYADAPFTEDGSAHCQTADPERTHFGYMNDSPSSSPSTPDINPEPAANRGAFFKPRHQTNMTRGKNY
ncbi:unnamed protein product [Arctogadus glacialis]